MTRFFGYELEFAAPYEQCIAYTRRFPVGFNCGTDMSADFVSEELKGFELRTEKFKEFPREKFIEALKTIKKHGGRIHTKCGFHIHFSGFGRLSNAEFNFLTNKLRRIVKWTNRSTYCMEFSRYDGHHYLPLRRIQEKDCDDHYEARVFNASLKIHALVNYHKLLTRLVEEAKNNATT